MHKIQQQMLLIFSNIMFNAEQWKEANPHLLCVDFHNPETAQGSMLSVAVQQESSYKVNPKNNLKAISMAISVTESWKQT